MQWFTSDHHFGHKNIIKYVKRPFRSVEEMDAEMICRWNEKVQPDDLVYHLGDFSLTRSWEEANRYFSQLNGRILLVPGGHDHWIGNKWTQDHYPLTIQPPLITLSTFPDCPPIVLCHYPLHSWDRSHYNSWHLYGHHHRDLSLPGKRLNVCVDRWNFYPISLEDVMNWMSIKDDNWDYVREKKVNPNA